MTIIVDGIKWREDGKIWRDDETFYRDPSVIKKFIYIDKVPIKDLVYNISDPSEKSRIHATDTDDGFFGSIEYYRQLRKSIIRDGIINPLEGELLDTGNFFILVGNTRLHICADLGYRTLPVIVTVFNWQEENLKGLEANTLEELKDLFVKDYYKIRIEGRKLYDEWWLSLDEKKRIMNQLEKEKDDRRIL